MMKRIYLVDDDIDDLGFIKGAFDNFKTDFEIKICNNGHELLSSLKNTTELPLFILMDLNMPVMSGLEALKLIRNSRIYLSLNVIIFSTSNAIQDRTECLNNGATDYLSKPYSIQEYETIVSKLLKTYSGSFSKSKIKQGNVQKSSRRLIL